MKPKDEQNFVPPKIFFFNIINTVEKKLHTLQHSLKTHKIKAPGRHC